MLDADEHDELRSLQARAYRRDAALSEVDAARLRELEDHRIARAAEAGEREVAEPGDAPKTEPSASVPTSRPFGDDEAETTADAGAPSTPPMVSLRTLARARWRVFAIAAVAVLVLGLGIGGLAFGRSGVSPVALTAEQQGWQDDLVASGTYDSGSIRALAVEEEVVIWAATRDGQVRTCLILSTGDVTMPNCDRTERVAETGIYGAITASAADDVQRQVSAQLLLTAAGEPAVAVSSYDYEPGESGITYANEGESQTAERLADDGFEPGSLWVVGYDGDVPVWTGLKLESQSQCLIYDGSRADAPMTCMDPETMQDQASSLVLNVTSVETGQVTHLEMASNRGPSYLVITREGSVTGAGGE